MSNPNENRTRKLSFLGFNTRELGNNDDPDEVLLDNEMEKVFAGSKSLRKKNKFDVSTLTEESVLSVSSDDYEQQRKLSDYRESVIDGHDKDKKHSSICLDDRNYDDLPEENSPLVSKRAEHFLGELSDTSVDEKRVQFTGPAPVSSGQLETDEDISGRKRRKSRHQYYRQRKHSHQEPDKDDPTVRKTSEITRKVSVQPEDFNLEEADINELTSHRSDDSRALRRPKIHHSSGRIQKLPLSIKKNYDHSPHEIFVQLDELFGIGKDREWKETARWIKYEEHVEEGSDRWGRPHVASLSFHSLLNLRRCLETGVVLLDLEEKDLPAVAYRVVEQMVVEEMIATDDKPIVMRALLLKHRHVNEHSHSHGFSFHKKKNSSATSLQGLNVQHINNIDDKKPKIIPASEINGNSKKLSLDMRIDMIDEHLSYSSSQEDLKKLQNDTILRRIPQGAEATTVLVGAVDFLEKPTIAFIRLAEGIQMPSITEVPIPVRFMFILMGPKIIDLDYHEVGRSIATLMSNEHFHDIAYKADDRKELLSAINEFLDDSIVLPPGNWDRPDLFPFEELKAKKDWIRSRKAKALNEKRKSQQLKKIAEDSIKLLTGIEALSGGGDGNGKNHGDGNGKDNGGYIPIGFDKFKKPPSPLEKTYRCWGGLLNDIKRRYSFYKSDIKDGLNTETLAASIFMYFASLSTAITFGGLMSEKTHNLIGISETLLSTSIVGLIFHTFGGQPLVIIGTTGPLLLFDEALFQFCGKQKLDFLTVRAYVGIWLVIIGLIVSAFEGSVYVRLLTRFTQEIFSALITLIYIFETFMKLVNVYRKHPLSAQYTVVSLDEYSSYQEDNVRVQRMLNLSTFENITTSDIYNNNNNDTAFDLTGLQSSTNLTNFLKDDNDHLINQPNTALFCTFLTLGTFTVAYYLKLFRNSHFLGRTARRALGDFGVPIAIALFVTVSYFIPDVYTEKLSVPEGLSPSTPERTWLVSYGPVEIWLPFLAGIPALLVYILIFMETHISELIVDKPERGLKKGSGLHLDIVILCALNCICGTFGMPWHCAATVRSVTHVSAVTIMSRTHAPGESPRIIEVKEQRLSGLFVSLMIGLSVTMTPLLRLIPMAVLFGVFLYMGVASMSGVQLFDRLVLYFMPTKHHPPTPYVKRLPAWKMHTFTGIQIFCLTVLWTVKSSIISLAFPFFLILMVPLRIQLDKFYSPKEMNALDGNPSKIEADDEPDFYEQAGAPA